VAEKVANGLVFANAEESRACRIDARGSRTVYCSAVHICLRAL